MYVFSAPGRDLGALGAALPCQGKGGDYWPKGGSDYYGKGCRLSIFARGIEEQQVTTCIEIAGVHQHCCTRLLRRLVDRQGR